MSGVSVVCACRAPIFLEIAPVSPMSETIGLPFSELLPQNWGSGWAQDSGLASNSTSAWGMWPELGQWELHQDSRWKSRKEAHSLSAGILTLVECKLASHEPSLPWHGDPWHVNEANSEGRQANDGDGFLMASFEHMNAVRSIPYTFWWCETINLLHT